MTTCSHRPSMLRSCRSTPASPEPSPPPRCTPSPRRARAAMCRVATPGRHPGISSPWSASSFPLQRRRPTGRWRWTPSDSYASCATRDRGQRAGSSRASNATSNAPAGNSLRCGAVRRSPTRSVGRRAWTVRPMRTRTTPRGRPARWCTRSASHTPYVGSRSGMGSPGRAGGRSWTAAAEVATGCGEPGRTPTAGSRQEPLAACESRPCRPGDVGESPGGRVRSPCGTSARSLRRHPRPRRWRSRARGTDRAT